MTVKILVVDDEENLLTLIAHNLEKEGFTTVTAQEGNEAWHLLAQEKPDLIILDLMLPGRDGLQICRDMRRYNINTPVIMLTACTAEAERIQGFEAGADDYITKPFSVRELVVRVKAVLRRMNNRITPENTEAEISTSNFVLKPDNYEIFFQGRRLELTLKEYELLELLLRNNGKVLKREVLWELLWDYSDKINSRVIDVHINRIRTKIELDSGNPRYIKTVRGLGYKFEDSQK
ncbi:MAG: response regulator transcription factor [Syntrophomonadaceae bacterium]|nr:response regulator transcription factor [Syntrophomonadaceae bacterium]